MSGPGSTFVAALFLTVVALAGVGTLVWATWGAWQDARRRAAEDDARAAAERRDATGDDRGP